MAMFMHTYSRFATGEEIKELSKGLVVKEKYGIQYVIDDKNKAAFAYFPEYSDDTVWITSLALSYLKETDHSDEFLRSVYEVCDLISERKEEVLKLFGSEKFAKSFNQKASRAVILSLFGIEEETPKRMGEEDFDFTPITKDLDIAKNFSEE